MPDFLYEEFPPHPGLRPEVRCGWRAVLPPCGAAVPPWRRVLPDGCTDVVVAYDQSHFIHEFTEFAGVTPTAYFARD